MTAQIPTVASDLICDDGASLIIRRLEVKTLDATETKSQQRTKLVKTHIVVRPLVDNGDVNHLGAEILLNLSNE